LAPAIQPVATKGQPATPAQNRSAQGSGLRVTQPSAAGVAKPLSPSSSVPTPGADDGTSQLLKWGGWTLATGIFFALLTKTLLGGIGPQGPHTNSGWMALIVTMMCLPFGFLLFALGALKWLRNRRNRES
jgi:hypothetical protein